MKTKAKTAKKLAAAQAIQPASLPVAPVAPVAQAAVVKPVAQVAQAAPPAVVKPVAPAKSRRQRLDDRLTAYADWVSLGWLAAIGMIATAFLGGALMLLFVEWSAYTSSHQTTTAVFGERSLGAAPIQISRGGNESLYGSATVKLADGGWAALTIHNTEGQSVGGLVVMAGTTDRCAGTKIATGWTCRNVKPDASETFSLWAENKPLVDPGVPSLVAAPRTVLGGQVDIDLASNMLRSDWGYNVDFGSGLPEQSLAGGVWLTGANGKVLISQGWADGIFTPNFQSF